MYGLYPRHAPTGFSTLLTTQGLALGGLCQDPSGEGNMAAKRKKKAPKRKSVKSKAKRKAPKKKSARKAAAKKTAKRKPTKRKAAKKKSAAKKKRGPPDRARGISKRRKSVIAKSGASTPAKKSPTSGKRVTTTRMMYHSGMYDKKHGAGAWKKAVAYRKNAVSKSHGEAGKTVKRPSWYKGAAVRDFNKLAAAQDLHFKKGKLKGFGVGGGTKSA